MSKKDRSFALTDEERARLRPSVDVAALERVLGAAPKESRRVLLVSCFRNPTDAELRSIGVELSELPELPEPREPVRPGGLTLADGREVRRLPFLPARNVDISIGHLEDPELDRLWQQVEPRGGAA